jgi:hypothetical protein
MNINAKHPRRKPVNPLMITKGKALALTNRIPFPMKLHRVLEDAERDGSSIVSWSRDGTSFRVNKPSEFVGEIMPYYFRQTQYKSFQRQLHIYGFERITQGETKGFYRHSLFMRSNKDLCQAMRTKKVNNEITQDKPRSLPEPRRAIEICSQKQNANRSMNIESEAPASRDIQANLLSYQIAGATTPYFRMTEAEQIFSKSQPSVPEYGLDQPGMTLVQSSNERRLSECMQMIQTMAAAAQPYARSIETKTDELTNVNSLGDSM